MHIQLLIQALAASVFCYLGGVESPWLLGQIGGYYIVGRPLVAGLILGLIFGDVQAGVLCGLAVQAIFVANLNTGGATNSEITYASYGGIGLALATTKNPAIAATLSIVIGQTFGLIFYNIKMALYSYWNKKVENAANRGDAKGIALNHFVYPNITNFLMRAVPVFLLLYFGQGFLTTLTDSMPKVITNIVTVLGGVLPAVGIGLLMTMVIKKRSALLFLFSGFVLMAFAGLSMIGLAFLAAMIAYLVYISYGKSHEAEQTEQDEVI